MFSNTMSYIIIVVAMIAMATIFVYRPEKFKALPYIIVTLMMIWMYVFSDAIDFDIYHGWLWDMVHRMHGDYFTGNTMSSKFTQLGFAAIPIITLIVMMIVKTVKEKKSSENAE